jgi:cysteine synthase
MCDSAARYAATYDDDAWLAEHGIDISPYLPVVERAGDEKVWDCP